MKKVAVAALGGAAMAGAAAAVHLAPGLPAVAPISDRLAPSLMGRGNPSRVALTFDDGPDPWSTPYFLTMLDDLGWRATFFVLGTMARQSPTLVAEMAAAGHELAVHGDEHSSYLTRGWVATRDDIVRARPVRRRAHGNRPSLVPASLRHTHAGGAADRARPRAAHGAVDELGQGLARRVHGRQRAPSRARARRCRRHGAPARLRLRLGTGVVARHTRRVAAARRRVRVTQPHVWATPRPRHRNRPTRCLTPRSPSYSPSGRE